MTAKKIYKSAVEAVNDMVDVWNTKPEIMVIDDEEDITKVFEQSLKKLGCNCHIAHTGPEAIRMYQDKMREEFQDNGSSQHPFELIFLDLKLPGGLKGGEVLKEIRKYWPIQPVAIISGDIEFSFNHELLDTGYIGLMSKPISLNNIRDILLQHNIRMRRPFPSIPHITDDTDHPFPTI